MIVPTIFQVEDDEDFTFLMENAIKAIKKDISLTVTTNGNDGMDLLNKYQEQQAMPGIILLDLNLPGMSGIDLLKIIREIQFFDNVPVVIFSTSDNPKDIQTALEFGANEFRTKPLGYVDLVKSLQTLYTKFLNA